MWRPLLLVLLSGCVGVIGEAPPEGDWPSSSIGTAPLRRLTPREHAAAVRDVFGVDIADVTATFPDDGAVDGFDNNAIVQTITPQHARRYQEAAEAAAEQLLASPERRAEVVGCEPAESGCLESFIERAGRLVYRRPLSPSERDALVALGETAAGDPDPYAPVSLVIRAMLQAPQFLFRVERSAETGVRPLTGYELATRLSFGLWGTTPPPALLDAAGAGELDSLAGLRAHATAMAADPRAREQARVFVRQWLRVPAMAQVELDPTVFPIFSAELREAAVSEVELLAGELTWGEASVLDLYQAPHAYVNGPLAALYGVSAPAEGFAALSIPERGGLFGTAGFLMVTSSLQNTSVVHRGKYVREVALCDPPPPPPADVSAVPLAAGVSAAEAFAQHSSDPACKSCHDKLDPIGLGLERFDAAGMLRSHYAGGDAVPLEGFVDEEAFAGAVELGRLVAASELASRCVVEQYLRFSFGKSIEQDDRAAVDALHQRFVSSGHRLEALVADVVVLDAFRFHRAER